MDKYTKKYFNAITRAVKNNDGREIEEIIDGIYQDGFNDGKNDN